MGVGKLGSMYGELTSISYMGSGQDSNPGPCVHQARTLTTAPSYYPVLIQMARPIDNGFFTYTYRRKLIKLTFLCLFLNFIFKPLIILSAIN